VNKEFDPAASAGPAPLDQVKESVHSDLQYVSIQVDGKTYGGWYRLLADGQMELLALANMHCERRSENTAIEQARGMLADFIRVARPKRADEDRQDPSIRTLGDLLYADKAKSRILEQDWVGLVQSIAAGEQAALHELYHRTYRVVFTLIMRLVKDREVSEELLLDVFHEIWRQARCYDSAGGSVVAWIMNQTRCKALDHVMFEQGKRRGNGHSSPRLPMHGANGSGKDDELTDHGQSSDVLRPSPAVWERLAQRVAAETGFEPAMWPATHQGPEPEWEEAAPGICCKLLATDGDKGVVSMLVRLAPTVEYPPHTHAGVEELHLLQGELWIDHRKLHPGDYNRAEPGTADKRVWSETGCTCVLITSTRDVIG
jgi:DNA-directed RNA polymerase specialized sigma24 family protein